MSKFENKVDFAVLVSAKNANPNGDPLLDNRPRTDYNGFGEISDVCIKRKIRNRMQDKGCEIFVKSDDRADDGYSSLKERADWLKDEKDWTVFQEKACEKWLDVRTFGQLFPFDSFGCKSVGVRGPVSIHQAVSIDPVEIEAMKITKSVSGEKKSNKSKGSDTFGTKAFVRFGLYEIKGSINVQLADKTDFSCEDAQILKDCLKTLFVNDASAARPDGSMEVVKVIWWEHNCKNGQYSSAKVHRSLNVKLKNGVAIPSSFEDYDITLNELDSLTPEIIDCV